MQGHFSSAPGTPVDRARALYLPSSAGRPRLGSARAVDPSCLLRQVRRSTTLAPRTFRVSSLSAPAASVAAGDRAPHVPWTPLVCACSAAGRPRLGSAPAVDPSCLLRQGRRSTTLAPRTFRVSSLPAPAASVAAGDRAPYVPWTPLACACSSAARRPLLGPAPAVDPSRLHRVRRPAPPLSCRAVPRPYDLRRQGRRSNCSLPYLPWVQFACAGSFGGRRRSSPARAVDFSRLRLRCRAVAHWRDIFHPSYLSAPASARSIVAAPQP
eukprot:tig00000282_g23834.t1